MHFLMRILLFYLVYRLVKRVLNFLIKPPKDNKKKTPPSDGEAIETDFEIIE